MITSVPTTLRLPAFDDLREHLMQLGEGTLAADGTWEVGQIFYHLAASFEATSVPSTRRESRRARLARWPRRMFLRRYGLPRGVPIPEEVRSQVEPPSAVDEAEQLARLRRAVVRFESREGRFPDHPVFGPLRRDEWREFHLRHCELHLGHIRRRAS